MKKDIYGEKYGTFAERAKEFWGMKDKDQSQQIKELKGQLDEANSQCQIAWSRCDKLEKQIEKLEKLTTPDTIKGILLSEIQMLSAASRTAYERRIYDGLPDMANSIVNCVTALTSIPETEQEDENGTT